MLNPGEIPVSWQKNIQGEFQKLYFQKLEEFLIDQQTKKTIFPPHNLIFAALKYTPFTRVKVVIIGQDPYHGEGQANGLAFSVNKGIKLPPSLRNIFKELTADLNCSTPDNGDLTNWAKQGILLLNTSLTVNKAVPNSHKNKGWEVFTDKIISILSEKKQKLVFILWGNNAKQKVTLINAQKHLILKAAHPSPFSAHHGFFGCNHFSKANNFLRKNKRKPINWCLK